MPNNMTEFNVQWYATKIDVLLHNVNTAPNNKKRGSRAARTLARALLMLSSDEERDLFIASLELQRHAP